MLLELVLWGLLTGFFFHLVPQDNYSIQKLVALVFFVGMLPIGAADYLLLQRFTRAAYVANESQRWLMQRHEVHRRKLTSRNFKQYAVWVPTIVVVLVCLFMDPAWALASHLFHPGSSRLIGYRVSIPLDWTVEYSWLCCEPGQSWSYATATKRTRSLLPALELLSGREPHYFASSMAFYGAAGDQTQTTRRPFVRNQLVSTWNASLDGDPLTCSEYSPSNNRFGPGYREISCLTPKGDFTCYFDGYEPDLKQFYATLQAIKKTK